MAEQAKSLTVSVLSRILRVKENNKTAAIGFFFCLQKENVNFAFREGDLAEANAAA